MIYSVDIRRPEGCPVKWLPKVEAFKAPRLIEFTPGLNILWGPNGSGKSTLLKLLALLFQSEQGGRPVVTESSVRALFDYLPIGSREKEATKLLRDVIVRHDGQGIRYLDPGHTIGRAPGTFDWDFGMEGILSVFQKGSAGETNRHKFEQVMGDLVEDKPPPEPEFRMTKDRVNSLWEERLEIIETIFKATDPKGPATYLLDEPERSFDLPMQALIWRFMRAYSQKAQLIVASHSVFALNIPQASYVELEPGYVQRASDAVGALAKWSEEKPAVKKPKPKAAKREEE